MRGSLNQKRVEMMAIRKNRSVRNGQQFRFLLGIAIGLIVAWTQPVWDNQQEIPLNSKPDYPMSHFLSATKAPDYKRSINQTNMIEAEDEDTYIGPRILCLVLTKKEQHETRAIYVKQTWGRLCNILLFMSTTNNDTLMETIKLNVPDGYDHLYKKTRASFRYAYKHYRNEADWFLKADDDTFIIVDNLRSFLKNFSPKEPIYFGCKFQPFVPQGYMSGGAGYVLSKAALKLYMDGLYNRVPSCISRASVEDVQMGKCLYDVGVVAGDSRDEHGSYRFNPFSLDTHTNPKKMKTSTWYQEYVFYPQPEGIRCCSDQAVSFHYVFQPMMYTMDYFLNILRLPYIF